MLKLSILIILLLALLNQVICYKRKRINKYEISASDARNKENELQYDKELSKIFDEDLKNRLKKLSYAIIDAKKKVRKLILYDRRESAEPSEKTITRSELQKIFDNISHKFLNIGNLLLDAYHATDWILLYYYITLQDPEYMDD